MPNNKLKIFICYAHEDEKYKDKLISHLSGLRRAGRLDIWHDRDIGAGSFWEKDILEHLEQADVGLMLVSDHFLSSDFINSVEMKRLIERATHGQVRAVPIVISACSWRLTPIEKLQALPRNGQPINTFLEDNGQRDRAWTDIVETIADWAEGVEQVKEQIEDNVAAEEKALQYQPDIINEASKTGLQNVNRTIMVCELVNLTDTEKRTTDQLSADLINKYRNIVDQIAKQYSGCELQRHVGTGGFLTFITPSEAIDAALKIQDLLSELSNKTKVQVADCIGLHQGEILTDEYGYAELVGKNVVAAEQLCKAADPGQILTSAVVFEVGSEADIDVPEGQLKWLSLGFFRVPRSGVMEIYEVTDLRRRAPAVPWSLRGADAPYGVRRLELSGYEIVETFGSSAMANVYKAKHRKSDQPVVLKMLSESVGGDPAGRERFVREIDAISRLKHKGIVSVVEVHDETNPPFFVMEWIDGHPINKALHDKPWDVRANVVAAICDALVYAHKNDIVHGDLKPGNLLIDEVGKPTVLDFSLSKITGDRDHNQESSSAILAGTAHYLAPEQISGESDKNPASDIYSLGVVLYEILTGEVPFPEPGIHRVLNAHLNDAPELPMLRNRNIPEPLQRICLKALEKKPADRYGSMREMKADLDRYLHGEKVSTRPSYYNNMVESLAAGHVVDIDRWHANQLITDEEHIRLRRGYTGLVRKGLRAISESRLIHPRVLALYLSGWAVLAGASMWLSIYYAGELDEFLVGSPLGRIFIGLLPAVVANGLWIIFHSRGSYRFAFVGLILGLLSVPFATGVLVHETAGEDLLNIESLRTPIAYSEFTARTETQQQAPAPEAQLQEFTCNYSVYSDQFFGCDLPNVQVFIALLVAIIWGGRVALRSETVTSATIVGLHFVGLYLVMLDFWGLRLLFDPENMSDLGFSLLPLAVTLAGSGIYVNQQLRRPAQAFPLFAIALAIAIFATQLIAIMGPANWDWGK